MFNLFNWSRNKQTVTIENFVFGEVRATGKRFFLATFTLDEKTQAAIVYCTKEHLKQLAGLAGRHYAGITFHSKLWATHLEKQNRPLFMSNAILYLRKAKVHRRHLDICDVAYVLDFIIDSSSEENDKAWLLMEKALTPLNLADKYNEFLRFLKLTEDESIARHCAGLEDVHLFHAAYVASLSLNDGYETEEVLVEMEE